MSLQVGACLRVQRGCGPLCVCASTRVPVCPRSLSEELAQPLRERGKGLAGVPGFLICYDSLFRDLRRSKALLVRGRLDPREAVETSRPGSSGPGARPPRHSRSTGRNVERSLLALRVPEESEVSVAQVPKPHIRFQVIPVAQA